MCIRDRCSGGRGYRQGKGDSGYGTAQFGSGTRAPCRNQPETGTGGLRPREMCIRDSHAAIYWHIAGSYSPITLIAGSYTHLFAGINEQNSEYHLKKGETFKTPALALTSSTQGLSGASRNFHKWGRKYILAHGDKELSLIHILIGE